MKSLSIMLATSFLTLVSTGLAHAEGTKPQPGAGADGATELQGILAEAKAGNPDENDLRYQLIKARLTIDGNEPDALTVAVFNVIFSRAPDSLKAFLTDDDYAEKVLKTNALIVEYVRDYMQNRLTPEMQGKVNDIIQQLFPSISSTLPGLAS